MRIIALSTFFILASLMGLNAQLQQSRWTDHLSYNNCINVFNTSNWIYALSSSGIVRHHKETGESNKFSKINLLTEVDLTAFLPLGNADDFIVGYDNGNIDLYLSKKIFKLPDIKEKIITGGKKINQFRQIGNLIYAATNFGVVVVNPQKKEIVSTWYFAMNNNSVACYDIMEFNNQFWVATKNGLFVAPTTSALLNYYATWENIKPISCLAIQQFNNYPFAAFETSSNITTVSYFNNNSWNDIAGMYNFRALKATDNSLLISSQSDIFAYSKTGLLTTRKNSIKIGPNILNPAFNAAVTDENNNLWIADSNQGLLFNPKDAAGDLVFTPNGPATNSNQHLMHDGTKLNVSPGQRTTPWNNLFFPAQIYFYDGTWKTINWQTDALLNNRIDIIGSVPHPQIPYRTYFYSWGNGVFVADSQKIVTHFNPTNSKLKSIYNNDLNYVRVGGVAVNNKGELFINNSHVGTGVVAFTATDSVYLNYKTLAINYMGDLIIDQNGYFWTYINRSSVRNGLFVFDTNQTTANPLDDRYKGPYSKVDDDDSRNAGQLLLYTQDGEVLTTEVHCIVEDKNGYIWVGTNKGPVVNFRPWAVFSEATPIFNRIKIPRNEGDNLADYLLEEETITCIAVDGGNRKWLGTLSSGVFLVSEDGTRTIESYNTANSPLISNVITSIAINPKSGEVFIGTEKGIVSIKGTATEGSKNNTQITVFPNPVRPEYAGNITIKGLVANSNVKITDVSGKLVFETQSLGGQAIWDGRNLWGEKVQSGVYMIMATDQYGQLSGMTKVLIVR